MATYVTLDHPDSTHVVGSPPRTALITFPGMAGSSGAGPTTGQLFPRGDT